MRFSLIVTLLVVFGDSYGQDNLWYIRNYRPLIEERFNNSEAWYNNRWKNLDAVVEVTLDPSNNMDITIPLIQTVNGDSTVIFCNTRLLRKYYKKTINFHTELDLTKACVAKMKKSEIASPKQFNYDSIFKVMEGNIKLNRAIYSFDAFVDSNQTSYCCLAGTYYDRLKLIYYFFINGILLVEDSHTGRLHYMRY